MALILKDNPVGVDAKIDVIQRVLFDNLQWTNYESYHRAYINPKDGKKIPEVYVGNGEYQEVFYNDEFTASSHFIVQNDRRFGELYQAEVSLIFHANLEELYPSILHRADEEMHRQISLILEDNQSIAELNRLVTGVDSVYRGLDVSRVTFTDMSEKHVVRFDLTINYQYIC